MSDKLGESGRHTHTHTHTQIEIGPTTHILFLLFDKLNSKEPVGEWVNDYQDVSKGSFENCATVVPGVFAPNNVHLIVAKVTHL